MDTRHAFEADGKTGSCGHDLARTMRATAQQLDMAAARSGPDEDGGVRMSAETQHLARLLQAGAFAEAISFCTEQARDGAPGRLPRLFLPLVQHLEAAWERDAIEIAELSFAFFQIRRLIEISARRAGPPMATHGLRGAALLAVPPGESHGFGLQIVADEMRLRSWQVTTAPEGSDPDALQRQLRARRFDVLGLSIGHDDALAGLGDLIVDLRMASRNPGLVVILGGAGLAEPASQYHFLGADHVALDASDGVRALDRLALPQTTSKGN